MKLQLLIFFSLIAIVFSFLQFFEISLFGVHPNFAIVIISVISAFIHDIWEGIFIVSLSTFILKFSPYFNSEIMVFFILGILIMILSKYLPWNYFINTTFLIFSSSIIFYIFLAPTRIISIVFFQEIFYNILIGGFMTLLIKKIIKD